jgi:hypothetical protein
MLPQFWVRRKALGSLKPHLQLVVALRIIPEDSSFINFCFLLLVVIEIPTGCSITAAGPYRAQAEKFGVLH